jgi:uncharacterized membrane protein YdbT with pleckstrin-like domain
MSSKDQLLEVRRSWWIFAGHLSLGWLLVPVAVAVWQRASLVVRVYTDRVVVEKGILSKDINEIFIDDIRTLRVRRSFLQRILGIGDAMIATAGNPTYEIAVTGLPNPTMLRDLIIAQRKSRQAVSI